MLNTFIKVPQLIHLSKMEEKEYLELLEKGYADLPEVLHKKERFEIPQVTGRVVKSRTVIRNFKDIAKHFARSDEHFFKFMLKEVGVRGDLNPRGELTLHSKFQPAMLNKAVESYFEQFVKCPHCTSPDTVFTDNNCTLKCNACGHQEKISQI